MADGDVRLRRRRRDEPPGEAQARAARDTKSRYLTALDWARQNVPDEFAPFAASAATTLKHRLGHWPTAEDVRDWLREQGRDSETLRRMDDGDVA